MPLIADEIKTLVERARNNERVHLHGVDWNFYEAVLEEVGDDHIRVTYDGGEIEIMAPSECHENDICFVSDLVKTLLQELKINARSQRSRTWRRKDLDCGLEADDCFYIQSYPRVPRTKKINLPADPPPDLAIEIDISHNSLKKQAIYAKLGVPELWRDDKGHLAFYILNAGKYEKSESSLAFPGLTAADVERFVASFNDLDPLDAMDVFRKWVRKNLK